ncbi:hypothetical protein C8R44DRAFT_653744 [Mycena epipterygia]|nr:hypothetical protein C8R44DRAFT_653744 [Mycena epipterygia]
MRFTDSELALDPKANSRAPFPVARPRNLLQKQRPAQHEPLIYLANGQTLSQRLVRPRPGQVGWQDPPRGNAPSVHSSPTKHGVDVTLPSDDNNFTSDFVPSQNPATTPRPTQQKRTNQWYRWTHHVIPELVPIFIKLIHDTTSFRDTAALELKEPPSCACAKRRLDIAVVRMLKIEHIHIRVCSCCSAPKQLLKAGLFACSPQHPSLAVDVEVLEFARRLFVNMPPNNTAWCNTLETFLSSRGYKLKTRDTLRVRFGNALEWYISMEHATNARIEALLDTARTLVRGDPLRSNSPTPEPSTPDATPSTPIPPATPTGRPPPSPPTQPQRKKRQRASVSDEEDDDDAPAANPNPFPEPPPRRRPSDYLISRCPACFGGLVHDPSQMVDVNVCIDACFTQKRRRKGARDPPRSHPHTVFVPEPTAERMNAHVEQVRPSRTKAKAKERRTAADDDDDVYEAPNLKVPRSVLNECESSFKAADEKREKASVKFFDDTGIMAMLCRHDRVLWLVNMRTAGEKQYFVLVLAEMLFQHLPANIRVGLLYDIACQLHRSCVKFGFLDRYIDRLFFAVSVFHAFGHRWPCQIIYHPLKCCGFGFTNGEGCERFWHSISKLIAYLRVSGYHHRLYTIDSQIEHADKMSLGRLAGWLLRRTAHCEEKLRDALAELEECGIREEVLRAQWAEQVKVQTKPAPRRSKNHGIAAVEQVLQVRQNSDVLFQRVASLEESLEDEDCTPDVRLYAQLHLDGARAAWKKEKEKAARLERELGVDDTTVLKKLAHAPYYSARMNARALKERLRAKLRDRKFELDPIERSFRRTASENQRNEHAGAAIKRREPNIARLAKAYNKVCDEIAALIKAKKAPKGVVAPLPVPAKGLYQLDVDDVIWQDLGLDGDDEAPPPWLSNDKVRAGIRAMLQKDRCAEEAPRLLREHGHLRTWFSIEWKAVCAVIEEAEGAELGAVRYQFELRRDALIQLCVLWKKSLDRIAIDDTHLPEWGPTQEQLLACQISDVTASWGEGDNSDDEAAEGEDEEDEDEDLFQILGAVERADNHRVAEEEEDEGEATWASDDDFFC